MQNFTMTQTVERKVLWKLKAPTARIGMSGSALLEEPEVLFFREGRHASTAHAAVAKFRDGSQDVRLEGDVVIVAHQEKTTLRTQTLDYLAQQDRIHTEDDVFIERPGAKLKGRGLEADAALNDITIFHQETVIR